ncbi:hypothetical protein [Marispirochaeta sp.]|uniref:sensor histidine kinase n=1 Tax=Marispirochaeta sp. TaxID=2038653 RepID=UPI0029C7AB28|nr:hypothetical protein [Marispirochaeta sp.]
MALSCFTCHSGCKQLAGRLEGKVREGNSLSIALGKLLQSCTFPGLSLEFLLRENERPLPENLVGELVNCSREGITNAVKHGKAQRIDLVLLYGKKQIILLLADNGSGCRHCCPGNGLGLMRSGLDAFDGSLTVWSEPGEGFQLTLRVPYPAEQSFVTAKG